MFGYIGDLRTMTSGRGQFSMEFSHYAPTPKNAAVLLRNTEWMDGDLAPYR